LRGLLRQLDASVEASGPYDFAVRKPSALVRSAARVHRIPPRARDDRDTPLQVVRDGSGYAGDLGEDKTKIFFAMGLDSGDNTKSSPSGA
jgi:hypothetical protein